MTPGLLAAGAGLFLLPLMIGGGLLFNRLRDDRRLAGRFDGHRQR